MSGHPVGLLVSLHLSRQQLHVHWPPAIHQLFPSGGWLQHDLDASAHLSASNALAAERYVPRKCCCCPLQVGAFSVLRMSLSC